MRILVIGAGAVGGYFGGRLLDAGRDVTFLVRPRRAEQLARSGLEIRSPAGNVHIASPPTIRATELREPFDVVLLSCKAYDLEAAIADLAPAVGPKTALIPLLNGMRHLYILDAKFGPGPVMGGRCFISARLDEEGRILHLSDSHELVFGPRSEGQAPIADAAAAEMSGAGFDCKSTSHVILEMWEKWVFLATLAGTTCLMRSAIGDIAAAGGSDLAIAMLEECRAIAEEAGFDPREEAMDRARRVLTAPGSTLKASMLGDVERGSRTEADHILGDLLRRRATQDPVSLLRVAYTAVKAHESRLAREGTAGLPTLG